MQEINAKEQFATYKISFLLKELGFDKPCFGIWINRGTKVDVMYVAEQDDAWMAEQNDGILAPLWQQAIDFLKEKKILVAERWDGWEYGAYEWNDFIFSETKEEAILKSIKILKNE